MGESIKKYRRTKVLKSPNFVVSTSAYAAGDAVSTLQTVESAFRTADQAGVIEQIVVIDLDGQDADLDLFLYEPSDDVTGGTDNAAYAPSDDELGQCVGILSVVSADYKAAGSSSVATVDSNLNLQMDKSQNLAVQVVARSAPTYSASDNLQIKLIINQD